MKLDHEEGWVPNWCFWIMVLEITLESPLDCKEFQPVHPKGNQPEIYIWRTDAKAQTPILWLLGVKNWPIGKDPDAGKDWRQAEKGTTKDEMVGWHHRLDGHEFEQATGVNDRQRSLVCFCPQGRIELDTTERLNWNLYLNPGFLIHHVRVYSLVNMKGKVTQSNLTLRHHGLCSSWNSPGQNTGVGSLSLLQGIFLPRDRAQVSHIAGGFFTSWATREAQEYWSG